MVRGYRFAADPTAQDYWNRWYTASRETEELRLQSLQMGRSLLKLFLALEPDASFQGLDPRACNYCIAYGVAASYWQIELHTALLGYLHSWVANLVNAGIKLIPLGQTQGQQVIANLGEAIALSTETVLNWKDEDIESNSWGLQLASMTHETLYSRIFRS
jgi:urease accessory protein